MDKSPSPPLDKRKLNVYTTLMTNKEKIIRLYEEDLKHPSYGYIAKKVGLSKKRVWDVIKQYKERQKHDKLR